MVLPSLERPGKALVADIAAPADLFRFFDLPEGWARIAFREK
jgi:hypothetical protein